MKSIKYKIRVYHSSYGCDTGCCGHRILVERPDGDIESFEFDHPYGEDHKTWARNFAEEYLKKKHPECLSSIDWDTLDYEDVTDNC